MKLDKEELIRLVKIEAEKLKQFTTENERSKLNFEKINADERHRCIYGQMTNDCFSPRSIELIEKCASKMYEINGKYKYLHSGTIPTDTVIRCQGSFSPIEIFISFNQFGKGKKINNKVLIDYLKGITDTLEFV